MKFFTADTHFNHENVLKCSPRGRLFSCGTEHDLAIIEGINSTVGEKDELYILGDVAWTAETSWVSKIRCKYIHHIIGNHDRTTYGRLFVSTSDVREIKLGEHKCFLSHYPHAYWPASHHGSLHLYGHCHSQREATLDLAFPGRRSMDVGVDNALIHLGALVPFNETQILDILLARPGHDMREFYDNLREQEQKKPSGFEPLGWCEGRR